VKHGFVAAPKDWPYSSFGAFVEQGLYPLDWAAGCELAFADHFGE
jgi:putative transposase